MRLALTLALLASACTSAEVDPADADTLHPADVDAFLRSYVALGRAAYTASHAGAVTLQGALTALTATPTQAHLDAARQTWTDVRADYGQTEAFRFYSGPIDAEGGPEGQINSWPLDEVYLDYVADPLNLGVPLIGGIVNDPIGYPEITEANLAAWNQPQDVGETAVSTGYHAIEFLLWGQDLSPHSAGDRPVDDFIDGQGTGSSPRRRAYLDAAGSLLVSDLQFVVDAFQADAPWVTRFLALSHEDALRDVLTGIGSLSGAELAGERMQVAWDSQSQEDEHSCFSDTTHRDLVANAQGILNVWTGQFTPVDGAPYSGDGLRDLVAALDPALAQAMDDAGADVLTRLGEIDRFDAAIGSEDGRAKVKAAIDALGVQTGLIVEVATLLGVQLNLEG